MGGTTLPPRHVPNCEANVVLVGICIHRTLPREDDGCHYNNLVNYQILALSELLTMLE